MAHQDIVWSGGGDEQGKARADTARRPELERGLGGLGFPTDSSQGHPSGV